MSEHNTDSLPVSFHDAITALSYSIKTLGTALEGNSKAIECINKTIETIRERYEQDIIGLQNRVNTHSMRCVFAPEKDGIAQKTLDRVDRLEINGAKLEGALVLVKWMGFGTLVSVVGLGVKAIVG